MQRSKLSQRVEFWRVLIAPEWRITLTSDLSFAPDDAPKCRAAIKPDEDYHHALLFVADRVLEDELGEVDVTIVHELLHLLFRELRRVLDLVDGQMHRDVATLAERHMESAEEAAVERLARVIARSEHPEGLLYGVATEDGARE